LEKCLATEIFKGRERRLNERSAALASHYAFEPRFCLPGCGNEKPYTEKRVYPLQRWWVTPVPRVKDLAELNDYLRRRCRAHHGSYVKFTCCTPWQVKVQLPRKRPVST
jgi:hypothetical protein